MASTARLLVLPALLLAAACGDDGGSSDGSGGGGDGGSSPGGVGLDVRSVERTAGPIEGSAPAQGDDFAIVELTLANGTEASVPLLATGFTVKDDAGIEYRGDPRTELLDGGCPADALVSPGGETTCKLLFEPPASSVLTALTYTWELGSSQVPLDDVGGGGGSPGTGCAAGAVGDHLLAVGIQLDRTKPLFFDVSVVTAGEGLMLNLIPLRTPYRTVDGAAMEPLGLPIPFPIDVVASDGSFTAETGEIAVPGDANPFSPSDLVASLTLTGTACPGEPDGSFCGTVSGQVTAPIDLELDGTNTFAFNPEGATQPVYDCAGSAAAPF